MRPSAASMAVMLLTAASTILQSRCLSPHGPASAFSLHTTRSFRYHKFRSLTHVTAAAAVTSSSTTDGDSTAPSSDSTSTDSSSSTPNNNKVRKSQLRDELRRYRIRQSEPLGKPPYFVFSNAAMEGIYRNLPTTAEQLLDVKGIGPKKLEMFGEDILNIVGRYVSADSNGGGAGIGEAKTTAAPIPRPATIDPESLTEEQRHAAHLALDGEANVFLTGAAGTGKSYVVRYIIQELKRAKSKFAVCAPTGVAAVNVGGSTLNAFFGIGLGNGSVSALTKKVTKNKQAVERIDATDILLIDECSMLSDELLEKLDAVARSVRNDGKNQDMPFGGIRIIMVGDFFQLPPIYRNEYGDADQEWRPFCFDSPVWADLGLDENRIELREVLRQGGEDRFVDFLNLVRVGQVREGIIRDFNAKCLIGPSRPLPDDGIIPTRLYVLNRDVDNVNEARLAELKGKEMVCTASNEWREIMPTGTPASVKKSMKDSIEKEMPEEVRLKVGAQVMLTRNKDLDRNLVNGSRGIVERYAKGDDGDQIPIVRFDTGVVEKIAKVEAVRYNPDGGQGCLVRKQIPLKLAWAVTVHKSQGTTLTRAMLDLSSAFEFGQVYVALSRVRSLDGLWLERPARLGNIMVSPQVLDFYDVT